MFVTWLFFNNCVLWLVTCLNKLVLHMYAVCVIINVKCCRQTLATGWQIWMIRLMDTGQFINVSWHFVRNHRFSYCQCYRAYRRQKEKHYFKKFLCDTCDWAGKKEVHTEPCNGEPIKISIDIEMQHNNMWTYLDGFKQKSADNAQIKNWGSFLHFTLHCAGHLGPIFVQKDVVCAFFNHFVTLQSSEDRTQKKCEHWRHTWGCSSFKWLYNVIQPW